MRDLLSKYEFDGDNAPIIRGSALGVPSTAKLRSGKDKVMELMEAVDSLHSAASSARTRKPFLMPVEDVFSITGRGTVADGPYRNR